MIEAKMVPQSIIPHITITDTPIMSFSSFSLFRIITVIQTRDPVITDSINAKMHSRYNRMPSSARFMWDHERPNMPTSKPLGSNTGLYYPRNCDRCLSARARDRQKPIEAQCRHTKKRLANTIKREQHVLRRGDLPFMVFLVWRTNVVLQPPARTIIFVSRTFSYEC